MSVGDTINVKGYGKVNITSLYTREGSEMVTFRDKVGQLTIPVKFFKSIIIKTK